MGQAVTPAGRRHRTSPFAFALVPAALVLTLATSSASARDDPRGDDVVPFDDVTPRVLVDDTAPGDDAGKVDAVIDRLDGLESRLERLDEKLDRLEALLRAVHGERLRRVEALSADPAFAAAARGLAERHGIANVEEYLLAEDPARTALLVKRLARVSAERGAFKFCSDPDVARVAGAVAARRDYMAAGGQRLVVSIAGGNAEAVAALVTALIDLPSAAAREAALWAAPFARDAESTAGNGLGRRLSHFAAELDDVEENARLALVARAAAASHGDSAAEDALAELVRSRVLDGALVLRVAANLRAAGSVAALRVYVELVLDEKYAYAAAQAVSAVDGFGRVIGWREVKEGRRALRDELDDWLRRNRARIRHTRGRFRLESATKDEKREP